MIYRRTFAFALLALAVCSSIWAADKLPTEGDYYPITRFETPPGAVLEAGAFQLLPDGRLALATRRGEIWLVDQPFSPQVKAGQFKLFAHGLHEVLGLAYRDGWLYVTQRCDVSRLRDTDGDGLADDYELVNDEWEISGDYHEYAFGSKFDRDGNLWVVLCLTGSFDSNCRYRGWCVRITPQGKLIPTTSGIRSPGGIGANADGEMFYTDNQGPWNGTCELKHLIPGKFVGHPGGNKWYELAEPFMGPRPKDPNSGSRFVAEAKKIPEYEPPTILFPYDKMGKSASGVACDLSGGKFGPFSKQLFVGDQSASTIMRCYLEKVQGHYQGVCFPWREGIGSGTLPIEITPDGAMFVGGTNRGWGSRGPLPFSIERINFNGKTPFEVHEMHARPDGFELAFTEAVDGRTAADPASYRIGTYTYIYQATYGSPEVDHTTPVIKQIDVSSDRKSLRLHLDRLQEGHVHEFHFDGLRNEQGLPLLHKEAYYTLNYLP